MLLFASILGLTVAVVALTAARRNPNMARTERQFYTGVMVIALLGFASLLAWTIKESDFSWALLNPLNHFEWSWLSAVICITMASFALTILDRKRPIWSYLFILSLGLLVTMTMATSWWVFGLTLIGVVFYSLDHTFRYRIMIIISVLSFLGASAVALGTNTTELSLLRSDIKSQLQENNDKLTASYTEADKQLQKQIDELKGRLEKVEGRVSKLEKTVDGIQRTATPADIPVDQLADKLSAALKAAGWKLGDYRVGSFDRSKYTYNPGNGAFVPSSVDTLDKLVKYLNGASAQSQATRNHVLAAVPASERQRLLSGQGYIPFQSSVDYCMDGNTMWDGKSAVRAGLSCHNAGDVVWIYVGSDGKIYWDASVRWDCGNGGMTSVPAPRRVTPAAPAPGAPRTTTPAPKPSTPGTPGTPTTSHAPSPTPTTSVPTTGTPTTGTPTTSTPSVTLEPKNPTVDGGNRGNMNENTGPGAVTTPTQPPAAPRVNPPAPAPAPTQAPVVPVHPDPIPTATVAPSAQPPNNGQVPVGTGDPNNPF